MTSHLGSTMKLTGSKGEITASFTYGTYGELLSGDNRLTKFFYNGRCGVTTDDNGLYYMRQRYYNPEIKRFVNQDILTGSLGNSQSLNRYSYTQGNPVSYTDPFGLSPLSGGFTGATYAHVLYAVLGCIPGSIGVTANLADGILYAFEGNYMMATVCLLGATTMGATRMATTYAAKATKAASITQKVSLLQKAQRAGFVASLTTAAGGSLNLARSYEQARRIVYKESDLAQTASPGEAYSKEEKAALGMALFGCLLSSCGIASGSTGMGRAVNELNALNRMSTNTAMADIADGVCFVAGTRIMTAEGGKNIEEIQTGDLVYSKNAETGETGYKKVVRLFQKETTELTHLEAGGVSITPPHPFWVDGYGFKAAGELVEGDLVEDSAGNLHPVTRIWKEHLDEPVIVYNFEVEDWHTYYVSEAEVFVHNMCAVANRYCPYIIVIASFSDMEYGY